MDFRNKEVYMKNNSVIPIGGRKFKQFKEEYLRVCDGQMHCIDK